LAAILRWLQILRSTGSGLHQYLTLFSTLPYDGTPPFAVSGKVLRIVKWSAYRGTLVPMKLQAEGSGQNVLLVDDDVELCQLICQYLAEEGIPVEAVHRGEQGLKRALSGEHAIVVLDVMLPGLDGFEVLRQLRMQSRIPVLMLTARGDEEDRILGLEMGADDYLPKPFNPRELAARVHAILRRFSGDAAEMRQIRAEPLVVEDVELDEGTRVARRAGEEIALTAVEFNLLARFLWSAGTVLAREEIVRTVLGREFSPFDRSIDVHVSNLRKKLGLRRDGSERIKGVRGVGYLYVLSHHAQTGGK
jgi:DNA-binding response OmpR family regulator